MKKILIICMFFLAATISYAQMQFGYTQQEIRNQFKNTTWVFTQTTHSSGTPFLHMSYLDMKITYGFNRYEKCFAILVQPLSFGTETYQTLKQASSRIETTDEHIVLFVNNRMIVVMEDRKQDAVLFTDYKLAEDK